MSGPEAELGVMVEIPLGGVDTLKTPRAPHRDPVVEHRLPDATLSVVLAVVALGFPSPARRRVTVLAGIASGPRTQLPAVEAGTEPHVDTACIDTKGTMTEHDSNTALGVACVMLPPPPVRASCDPA